ncbi:MAG: hypothetical protein M3R00_05205 [Pseudomonadota bacterium]|nr:hypothetical protein [Pseudomonadota bacterium]
MLKLQTEHMFTTIDALLVSKHITEFEEVILKFALIEYQEHFTPTPNGFLTESGISNAIMAALAQDISPAIMDQIVLQAFERFVDATEDATSLSFTLTLRRAITKKLSGLAHYLLDNNLCMKELEPPDSRGTCLQLILYEKNYDEVLFLKILARERHINHATRNGFTALYMAAYTNESALRHLLKRPDIQIGGVNFTTRLIEFHLTKPAVITLLKEKVQQASYVLPINYTGLQFPATWLSDVNKERLLQRVKSMIAGQPLFRVDKELTNAFDAFLHDPTPLPFKHADRASIAADCLYYIRAPETINQNRTTLCGVACFMQHLVITDPIKFIYTVIELCEQGAQPKHLPLRVKSIPPSAINFAYQLSTIWLETVRHNYNGLFDYDSTSSVEKIRGLTRPFQLELMYREFGFNVLRETFQVCFDTSNRVGSFFDSARKLISCYGVLPKPFKLYGSQHVEIQDEDERFADLCAISEKSNLITILIKSDLLSILFNEKLEFSAFLYLIETGHYITIFDFHHDEGAGLVNFSFMTYGVGFSIELPVNDFKSHYLGAMAVEYNQPLLIEDTPIMNEVCLLHCKK